MKPRGYVDDEDNVSGYVDDDARGNLAWLGDLDQAGQDEVLRDLVADEMCACGHRDDQHDADSVCRFNHDSEGIMNHACYAYLPVQR